MKRFTQLIFIMAMGFSIGIGIAHNQAQAKTTPHKVNICHGTASDKNPYVYISVDYSALKGHLDGTGPGHGKNNHSDFVSTDGTCNIKPSEPGGS